MSGSSGCRRLPGLVVVYMRGRAVDQLASHEPGLVTSRPNPSAAPHNSVNVTFLTENPQDQSNNITNAMIITVCTVFGSFYMFISHKPSVFPPLIETNPRS
ncbi:hypothetical protein K440DRAFT_21692 [Wilcoxina mikolae CBS 423.85]|nr:hypothetical protein K440DRAFT_21692 [Wilcoxina mikolae CBS 423.85]